MSQTIVPLLIFFFFLLRLFFFVFLAVLGLWYCSQVSSSCSEQGQLFLAAHRLLIVVAPLVVGHRLQTHGLQ